MGIVASKHWGEGGQSRKWSSRSTARRALSVVTRGYGVTQDQMRLIRDEMIDIITDPECPTIARITAAKAVMAMVDHDDKKYQEPEMMVLETETTTLEQRRAKLLGDIRATRQPG